MYKIESKFLERQYQILESMGLMQTIERVKTERVRQESWSKLKSGSCRKRVEKDGKRKITGQKKGEKGLVEFKENKGIRKINM